MTIARSQYEPEDGKSPEGLFDAEFKPLSAEEAHVLRNANPEMSPWWVIVWQAVVAVVLSVVAGVLGGAVVGASAAYGAFSVVVPAALMVRGLRRQRTATQPGAVLAGFVVWESMKVALTVAMLLVANKVITPLNWLALVAGFVVTMKVYWVAAWLHSRRRSLNSSN